MQKCSLCYCSDVYILDKGTIGIAGAGAYTAAQERTRVMPMYNLREYSNNYAKTLEKLRWYFNNVHSDPIVDSESFKFMEKITGNTPAASNTKDVEIAMLLKFLSNLWRALEMSLINCEIIWYEHDQPILSLPIRPALEHSQ